VAYRWVGVKLDPQRVVEAEVKFCEEKFDEQHGARVLLYILPDSLGRRGEREVWVLGVQAVCCTGAV
jgi:hypothetical protein